MPTIDMASARHVDGSGTQLSFTPSDVLATQYFRWLDSNLNNALDAGEELQTFPSHYYQGSFNYNGNDFFAFQHVSNGRNWLFSSTTNNVADYPFGYRHGDFALDTSSVALCFAPGTLIATSEGQKTVESLRIGDVVRTATGKTAGVLWIGRQTVSKLFTGPHMQPVRIRAGALGNALPHSDLTVTADHGMVIEGLVINASALVNGDTIDFVPMDELEDSFIVYHIETKDHDVILANGAPAETFVDAVTRSHFDNYQEYLDLYGAERIIPEMDRPRISSRRLVPQAIRTRLGLGAGQLDKDLRRSA